MVLAPDMRGEEVIQRCARPPPRQGARDLQPLGVLVEHGIADVNESLVTREKAVTSSDQISLEPTLAELLDQDLDHPAVLRQMDIVRFHGFPQYTLSDIEDRVDTVSIRR